MLRMPNKDFSNPPVGIGVWEWEWLPKFPLALWMTNKAGSKLRLSKGFRLQGANATFLHRPKGAFTLRLREIVSLGDRFIGNNALILTGGVMRARHSFLKQLASPALQNLRGFEIRLDFPK
ncbi:hypothetical protein H5410_056577 [Solanum commersonii]|uniref:Uncharacterized protein n=1 Tax=Solanum commersonii TaxID=4109 RepID=A0A9J5WKM3_SOLCO|nr:hypothetical protein H5410_056577 [Solanum commersonii]